MIEYSIRHHVPGRIRIFVPLLRGLSIEKLEKLVAAITPTPPGIEDVSANPITGSLVIKYDRCKIDILSYIKTIASNEKLLAVIECATDMNSTS